MPTVTFVDADGTRHEVEANSGVSLMQVAIDNGIEGIVAECGGACSCATCHCYVEEEWQARTGEPDDMEKAMLECVLDPMPNSRLSCQITLSEDLDGLVVSLPEAQF